MVVDAASVGLHCFTSVFLRRPKNRLKSHFLLVPPAAWAEFRPRQSYNPFHRRHQRHLCPDAISLQKLPPKELGCLFLRIWLSRATVVARGSCAAISVWPKPRFVWRACTCWIWNETPETMNILKIVFFLLAFHVAGRVIKLLILRTPARDRRSATSVRPRWSCPVCLGDTRSGCIPATTNGCSGAACLVCSDCLIRIYDDANRTPKCPLCRREFDDIALLSQFVNTGRAVVEAAIERHRDFRDY